MCKGHIPRPIVFVANIEPLIKPEQRSIPSILGCLDRCNERDHVVSEYPRSEFEAHQALRRSTFYRTTGDDYISHLSLSYLPLDTYHC